MIAMGPELGTMEVAMLPALRREFKQYTLEMQLEISGMDSRSRTLAHPASERLQVV
jgi:hypothetical protein